jgi:PAS domain S-box-containing protein
VRRAEYERNESGQIVRMVGVALDVTERRESQQAARESDAQFRALTQSLPNLVWMSPPDGQINWFNDRTYAFTGATEHELTGAGWLGRVHPEDRQAASGNWEAALTVGAAYETEFRILRADGEYRWHLTRAMPMVDPDGTIIRWVGTSTDIHERKLAEAESTRDRNRMWALSQELMLVSDLEGVIRSVNPSAERILGWSTDEMIGRNFLEFVHPDDVETTAAEVRSLAQGKPTLAFENWYRAKSGDYRLLDWTAVPDDGLIHGVARDVTDERATAAERERIWTTTNDLMATASADGFLKSVNPAWKRLLGYEESELLSRPYSDFAPKEDHQRLAAAVRRLSSGEAVTDLEHRLIHKDGQQSLIAWSADQIDSVLYVVGRNVTEQRLAEDALRQSQKMEAVGQLTGGIAHDFNNLLQGITGSLDLVQRRVSQGRTQELDRFITGAMNSANRAAALTHRLLAFSRRQPLDPRLVNINPLLTSIDDLLRRTLGETIELKIVLADNLWLAKCDPNQLESAVLNLAINARDAMPDGGRLVIETANAALDGVHTPRHQDIRRGHYVCISVTDTGTGMSPETMAKAFEPFFTTKPIGQGTGLGLSMIYGFARQSEGYARIYSELGVGTTVKLYLPRHRGDAQEEDSHPELSVEHQAVAQETVLVVEDESVVRGLIVEVLTELGYSAFQAADGPSGLELLQSKHRIDLLITDVGLPGLNGRQLADAARELRPDLKVLFMTGYAESAAAANGFLSQGMSIITKPFAMEVMATKIRQIIEGRAG